MVGREGETDRQMGRQSYSKCESMVSPSLYLFNSLSNPPPPFPCLFPSFSSADLRRNLVRELKRYTRKAKPTGKLLGSGTYGSVMELTSAGETVAGKVFRISSSYTHQKDIVRICGEVILMIQLRHPNIVQCKGVCFLVDQHLPVLLMEWLMTNLHTYLLDPTNSNLPLHRIVPILHGVSSGLASLHNQRPAVIHRDLTGKNILLDSELTAKITDFGNSRIVDLDAEATPETFTSLPGTLEYMPPEAQSGNLEYTISLDVFSFGHLSLFTIIQSPVYPLLPPSYTDAEGLHVCSEVKRREEYLDKAEQLLGGKHSLIVLMKQCLHNNPVLRPHTAELVTRLQDISGTVWYWNLTVSYPLTHTHTLKSCNRVFFFIMQVINPQSPPVTPEPRKQRV